MAKYKRVFAGRKGEKIGDIVELTDDEARPLVKWGRVVPVDEPAPTRAPRVRGGAADAGAGESGAGTDAGA
ncbi:hypothetical protein SEA_DARDANUS_17 [Gordonia phage Dardanus]|uniref:Uncharacterized protein n=1 Tax=Gordonia phage Dardanus TaxID=2588489 RepID=A0A514CX18_9CAUD|nr:hypothetical protein KDJ58_gp17 [Gordonia phage Dardanus]QDH85054.1 hypothetical protein SEA_DARDANUS_17 [Gordonia phage Dardanus]